MRIEARHIRRQRAVCLLGGLIALGLALRLASLQLWAGDMYSARAKRQHEKRIVLQANRGCILDRHGRVLATGLESQSFFVNRVSELNNLRAIAVRFSQREGENSAAMLKRLREKRSFVWLARKVLDGLPEDSVPEGVGRIVEMRRTYPMGALAGQVLGYTDIDNVGIEGIELAFNDLLKGQPGEMVSRVDARGKVLGAMGAVRKLPEDGCDLVLTLDADYQSIAEEELAAAVAEFQARSGIAIVTEPRTGQILAMANVPLYDPNAFQRYGSEVRRNRAVTDLFEPGSTFKVVALAGALEEGLYRSGDRIFCEEGSIALPGDTIRDTHPNGWLTVREIIEVSSNIGTIKIARALDKAGLFRYMRLFGFGSVTAGEAPGEAPGEVKHPSTWSRRSLETMAIGQEVGVTALQMAAAYGAVANGGRLMAPRIWLRAERNGEVLRAGRTEVVRRVISEKTAQEVTRILEGVVENGTGANARVPGYRVAGKTGTAQRVNEGGTGYDPNRYISSFIGFLPAERPECLCLVVIDSPKDMHWGSQVAAPVFSRIMRRILSLRRTDLRHRASAEGARAGFEGRAPVLAGLSQDAARRVLARCGPERQRAGNTSREALSSADAADGAGRVRIPDVTGFPLRQAVFRLTAAGLQVKASGSGQVVAQTPRPGEAVKPGAVCKISCE